MKTTLTRAGGFSFALILLFASLPAGASAQITGTFLARSTSYRYSSTFSRKIRALDDDPVKDLPIPILMGIAVRNLTPNFGDPRDGGARTHEGLDIMAPRGAYIVSPTDAVVTSTGTGDSSGKFVYTANPGGERFAYMHLDSIEVRSGDVLKPGDLIGTVGNTGNAAGGPTHLHFEIRHGREATDPFPRLTKEFSLKERVVALGEIVKDADDKDAEAATIVADYRATLLSARAQGIALEEHLDEALGTVVGSSLPAGGASFTRDLTLGSTGDDVRLLQSFLIAQDSGFQAKALAAVGVTGYFGTLTQQALSEYQAKQSISPAVGYFGPLTRSRILSVI